MRQLKILLILIMERLYGDVFTAAGVPEADAEICADVLIGWTKRH